ncbi:ABC transporter permease subunit [Paenibacillus sp. MBLB2552]|uniref:ABC transporter permease subunit n=1 Tax=Paenibacillus mellifer TaxID=2937794 RepID=A0A9X2BMX0_9BACL|nr:ABC transporter permease subunit [Paenibacillus mellifer]MCK8485612.1 ABC transporter permease subunit [Paenibacillus mellifer]
MKALRKYAALYLMMIPVAIYFLIYGYYPLVKGLQVSFQDYRLMGNGPYAGLANYSQVWHDPFFWKSLTNTLVIGGGILALGFVAPLVLALSLNEVLHTRFKKTAQMVLYIPHLLSWVIVGGIWIFLLSPDTGLVNLLLQRWTGTPPIHFLAESFWARLVMILVATWKDMGYNCILFMAGIVTINPSLYEAARMDGATRWQQVRYVTLPQLLGTMKVVLLLNTMGVLRIFDQVFVLRNPSTAPDVDVLMVYTFEKGIMNMQVGVAAAASFMVLLFTLALTLVVRKITRFDEVG